MKRIFTLCTTASLLFLSSFAASGAASDNGSPADGQEKVLATANGVSITENDLQQSLKLKTRGEKITEEARKTFLETVVGSELAAQAAQGLGLDRDPAYQKKLREAEAQLRAFRRENLASLYRSHVLSQAGVTETDARTFFDKNADRIRTRVHVWQIARRGEVEKITQDEKDLKNGVSFEEVAARGYPNPSEGAKPHWDLGLLHWSLVPQAWQEALDGMKPGETSGIIKGERGRYWILRLVDRKVDPAITFETEKQRILEILRVEKTEGAYEQAVRKLKASATIVISE